jgi:hypothetical protein
MTLNRNKVLKEYIKYENEKSKIKEYLADLETFETDYLIDPSNLAEQIRTCLVKSFKWAKIASRLSRIIDDLEVILEHYESLLWTEFKREMKDSGDKTYKEADIRARVRGDDIRRKIRMSINEWRYYNNMVKDGCFWPSTKLLDAAKELGQALRVANMSFSSMARKDSDEQE